MELPKGSKGELQGITETVYGKNHKQNEKKREKWEQMDQSTIYI